MLCSYSSHCLLPPCPIALPATSGEPPVIAIHPLSSSHSELSGAQGWSPHCPVFYSSMMPPFPQEKDSWHMTPSLVWFLPMCPSSFLPISWYPSSHSAHCMAILYVKTCSKCFTSSDSFNRITKLWNSYDIWNPWERKPCDHVLFNFSFSVPSTGPDLQ